MQLSTSYITGIAIILFATSLHAQRDKSYILQNTKTDVLQEMALRFSDQYFIKHARAIAVAKEMGWDTVGLQVLDSRGDPIYYGTNNNDAGIMTTTVNFRNTTSIEGHGMLIGQWEGGYPRTTHQDLIGRVTIMDSGGAVSSHSTHVGGTLIGRPPASEGDDSKGMAPFAQLNSYDWNNDLGEMTTAAQNGLLVSNHSYGSISGWDKDPTDVNGCVFGGADWTWRGPGSQFIGGGVDFKFGQYDGMAEAVDSICWNAPYYLPVKSSGNDHNDDPDPVGFFCPDVVRNGTSGNYVDYDPDIHPLGDGAGVSSIGTWGNAKNILTVGNLDDDQNINESSSRGMTDDGRIKPDICGNGTSLWSADSGNDTDYSYKTGTSMSSPNVAGSLLLLQQYYNEQNGSGLYMRSATLKGLALHTAEDLGLPGPDFVYGWGLLNTSVAGFVVHQDATYYTGLFASRMEEREFATNLTSDSYYFNVSNNSIFPNPLKVTMCYTDISGTGSGNNNETTPELVHDLDIRLYNASTGALVAFPFASGSTSSTPTLGDNDVDNVEQINVADPADGLYELRVTVEGGLTENQKYSLIVTGVDNNCVSSITHGTGTIPSYIYRSESTITSEGTVPVAQYVAYQATEKVNLNPGFKALPGSKFIAKIKGCD